MLFVASEATQDEHHNKIDLNGLKGNSVGEPVSPRFGGRGRKSHEVLPENRDMERSFIPMRPEKRMSCQYKLSFWMEPQHDSVY